ncbi:N-(5'-phosphoribosyl)anthranilate isomerase [[Candida] railenensis]|uniref:N-(5'-phosphoribosyl)anthranilate isomerase n=1 Tax=[Candida] railenensis TaxID=45579 RepID=A0A9P0VZ32_9ASCO|nr:N-(5'-phosphoribosyl)anthranilate isomerase [[Candida] railenensis]
MTIVKICGLKSEDAASTAIQNGANLLGMILVPGRARTVDKQTASKIVRLAQAERKKQGRKHRSITSLLKYLYSGEYSSVEEFQLRAAELIEENGPFVAGVFRNQSIEDVYNIAADIDLDIIQLHGSEDKLEYAKLNATELKYAIIPRFVIPKDIIEMEIVFSKHSECQNGILLPLLDSEAGGEGKKIDWSAVGKLKFGKYLLAGGLTPENVVDALNVENVIGVDVSGGVETDGVKDLTKVKQFIINAKSK